VLLASGYSCSKCVLLLVCGSSSQSPIPSWFEHTKNSFIKRMGLNLTQLIHSTPNIPIFQKFFWTTWLDLATEWDQHELDKFKNIPNKQQLFTGKQHKYYIKRRRGIDELDNEK
jgi:hypothetical protein